MSFTGEYRHTIDVKGRLIVPARLRDELSEGRVLLMRYSDPCIALWSGDRGRAFEEQLLSQRKASKQARKVVRELYSLALHTEVDRQGRIPLPAELRSAVGIDKEVVIVGAGDHAEIWDPGTFDQERQDVAEVGVSELFEQLDI